jgi:TolB-like protein
MLSIRRVLLGTALLAAATSYAEPVVNIDNRIATQRSEAVEFVPYAYQPILSRQALSPAGIFNSNMIFLADQVDRNRDDAVASKPLIVTSFANLDDLSETSSLGRLIGEQLMHEMKVRGWNVIDMRVTKSISVNPSGEFSLSRDLGRIRDTFKVGSVVVGTYTKTTDGLLISARVIDVSSGAVVSTAQSRLSRDRFTTQLVTLPTVYPTVTVTR